MLGWCGKSVPAACGPIAIGFFPAGRGCYNAIVKAVASLIADLVKRRDPVGREFSRFILNRICEIVRQFGR